jgi:hypothetical protein
VREAPNKPRPLCSVTGYLRPVHSVVCKRDVCEVHRLVCTLRALSCCPRQGSSRRSSARARARSRSTI